ncbi:unnamed protein product [Cercopithifilaria johnstoni]|uniref:Uncharacterized protein n=1 Tax=Cercopithifilaria johnstoni TaxID=2874296 RepID=A0A8J2M392_9BILA|nr:unnamed protein product [Cercopithifilaria johnstoni]
MGDKGEKSFDDELEMMVLREGNQRPIGQKGSIRNLGEPESKGSCGLLRSENQEPIDLLARSGPNGCWQSRTNDTVRVPA